MSCLPLLGLLLAADPRPQPAGSPLALIATTAHVHVRAHEDLDSDHLRVLARRNVTLWLSTRTNALRSSTLESVKRFGVAWIALRAPVSAADARQLGPLPTAGVWLAASELDGAQRVLGPRRLAVSVQGPIDDALLATLKRLRPSELHWAAPPEVDLLSWGQFRQLPGRKLLLRAPGELWPTACPAGAQAGGPALQVQLATLLAFAADAFPCGRGPRIEIAPDVDPAVLGSLLVREPSAELVVDVGDDSNKASALRKLLDALGLLDRGSPSGR